MPYYMKVQEYTNMESRDLWEYELSLDTAALQRMVLHAWELSATYFPYYFLNKNCSYQLLPLIEVSRSGLDLTPSQALWVIPADTLRAIHRVPGMVRAVRYRPAQLTKMRLRRALLNADEVRMATQLGRGSMQDGLAAAQGLALERRALVLDAASEFLFFRSRSAQNPGQDVSVREGAILSLRSRIDAPASALERPSAAVPPHEGHRTGRIGFGTSVWGDPKFEELSLRAGMHDLLDPSRAYSPESSLEMGRLRLRRDRPSGRVYLKEALLVDIASITPWDRWVRPVSWTGRTGLMTADDLVEPPWRSLLFGFSTGWGLAAALPGPRLGVGYTLVELDAGAGPVLRDNYRLGGAFRGGWLFSWGETWSSRVEAGYRRYLLGHPGEGWDMQVGQRFSWTQAIALRLNLTLREVRRSLDLGLQWYW